MVCPETKTFILFIIFSLVLLPVGADVACQSMSMDMTMDMSNVDQSTEKNSNFIDMHSAHKNSATTSTSAFTSTSKPKNSCDSDCCNCTLNAAVMFPIPEFDNNFILSNYIYSPGFFKEPNLKLQHPPPIISSL